MTDSSEIMKLAFMVFYMIYIFVIVIIMIKRKSSLSPDKKSAAMRVLFGFTALLIGDIGHVGSRLYNFLSTEQNPTIYGIGELLECSGLLILFICWIDAWRLEFSHSKKAIYYILIITGILGLIMFTFPVNDWLDDSPPRYWLIIRNMPWLIQGVGVSLLILNDAKKNDDKMMKKIGICILFSFLFYMPVIFIGNVYPMLGTLMIVGTIFYMFWQFYSVKRFFPSLNNGK